MKTTTASALINVAMWIGVSAAVIVALVFTSKVSVLWFFLIPLCGTISTMQTQKQSTEKEV